MEITECTGYQKLLAAVEKDEHQAPGFHDYRKKLRWIVERAKHYAEKTGLEDTQILDAWENNRRYWYMNYYQDCNQPLLEGTYSRVFDTQAELLEAIGTLDFRCPACGGISKSPYECSSGQEMEPGKICDWKVYGLFKDLGLGAFVFVKEQMRGETIFMPVAWETTSKQIQP